MTRYMTALDRFVAGQAADAATDRATEARRRRDEATRRRADLEAALARDRGDWEAFAATLPEPLAAIARLHGISDYAWDSRRYCDGCDQGCSCDSPEWPCSTVADVRAHQEDRA